MSYLSRDAIVKGAGQRRITEAEIPGMGTICLQSMTERERSEDEFDLREELETGTNRKDAFCRVRVKAIQRCAVNEHGEHLWDSIDEHLEEIENLDARVTEFITDAIEAHCGFASLNEEEHAQLEKKLEETNGDTSPTSLPESAAVLT